MEVIWNPGDPNMVILWVRQRSPSRRKEGESLYEADSEEQHLIPGQSLTHTLPLTHTKRHEVGDFLVSTLILLIHLNLEKLYIFPVTD